jgi:hypothetical protein
MVPTIVAVTSWLHAEEARTLRIANRELHRKSALLLISTTSNLNYGNFDTFLLICNLHVACPRKNAAILSRPSQLAKNMIESADIDHYRTERGMEISSATQHRANFTKKQQFFMMVLY